MIAIKLRAILRLIGRKPQQLETHDLIHIYPDDVFLVSYPKSGSTWLRFLIANYLTDNQCDFTNCHLIIPDIHLNPEQCNQLGHPRFIKSHLPATSKYKRVVYLVRDARDVAVSYYFHSLKYKMIRDDTPFGDFLTHFNMDSLDQFSSWSSHVNSWLNKPPADFLLVRYEDMKKDSLRKLVEILDFSGLPLREDAAATAVEASQLQRMKTLEAGQQHLFERLANSDHSIPFIRKGQVGDWKKFFSERSLKEFMQVHGPTMSRLGYL